MKEDAIIQSSKFKGEGEAWLWQHLKGKQPLHPERPFLPSEEELDAAEAEFDRIIAERSKPRRLRLWPWAASVAAAAAIAAVVFLLPQEEPQKSEEKPVVQCEPVPEKQEGNRADGAERADKTHRTYKTHKTHKTHKTYKTYKTHRTHKALQASQPAPSLTPHEEALANIHLAEEALQVVLEQEAQQEAIRAYAVSLTDGEPSQPIIAI